MNLIKRKPVSVYELTWEFDKFGASYMCLCSFSM